MAKYFARIFYRNSINIGLPLFECADTDRIEDGDEIEIATGEGVIRNLTKGETYECSKIPEHIMSLIEDGGLIARLKKQYRENS